LQSSTVTSYPISHVSDGTIDIDDCLEQTQWMVLRQSLDKLCDIPHPRSLKIRIHIPGDRVHMTRLGALEFRVVNHNLGSAPQINRGNGDNVIPLQQKSLQ